MVKLFNINKGGHMNKLYCDSLIVAQMNAEVLQKQGYEVFIHSYVSYDKNNRPYLNYYIIYRKEGE